MSRGRSVEELEAGAPQRVAARGTLGASQVTLELRDSPLEQAVALGRVRVEHEISPPNGGARLVDERAVTVATRGGRTQLREPADVTPVHDERPSRVANEGPDVTAFSLALRAIRMGLDGLDPGAQISAERSLTSSFVIAPEATGTRATAETATRATAVRARVTASSPPCRPSSRAA